ncbi:uncharacterized protein CANTADRAFT_53760 [Suhomyces tanzawaensis NRRL Y-17324]|uniref:Golgi pH regulator n=1 Tax=Suhomyces tanzawaensis NRRL Y-17324 TaxID=984487 RepID=A0A1E4SG88_9ASCO|nr:uncharacterized protein CANTADRAFT_53760 [Suhomyces tanzawaensis NRRL Y-17324]ODV78529.1 hypothetical protein CANTADRAFT_53760 [Suhomyces tanzawaensis NRRL Y-17324]
MLLLLLGSIPFLALLATSVLWIYRLVYDHQIIRTYSGRLHTPRHEFNRYIETSVNRPFGAHLMALTVDENDEDDYKPYDHKNGQHNVTEMTAQKDFHSKNKIIGWIFAAAISLGIELIVLMMCELIDVFGEDVRLWWFTITIDSLMVLLTFVVPFLIINLAVHRDLAPRLTRKSYGGAILTAVLVIVWLVLLHKCGDLSQSFKPSAASSYYNPDTRTLIERKVNEVSIAGITMIAILSGIGCTSTPYELFSLDTRISRLLKGSSINNLIQSYNNTNSLLNKRKYDLNNLLVQTGGTVYNQSSASSDNLLHPVPGSSKLMSPQNKLGGIIHKVQSFASISSLSVATDSPEEEELTKEIESLKKLRSSVYDEILHLISRYINARNSYSSKNSELIANFLTWANYAFAGYCIYRVVNVMLVRMPYLLFVDTLESTYQLHSKETSVVDLPEDEESGVSTSNDALAITLAKLVLSCFPNLPVSETQLINQLGFILLGSLFICSFSNVLITFKSFTRFLPANHASSYVRNWLKHLVIAELLGVYIIATALLIRTNLPRNLSHQISKILSLSGSSITSADISRKEVEFIDGWFDKVFAVSCIVTMLLIFFKKQLVDSPTDHTDYDEELFIEHTNYKMA